MKRARSIVCVLALLGALPACGGGSARPGDATEGGNPGGDGGADHTASDAPADQIVGIDLAPDLGGDAPAGGDGSSDVAGDAVADIASDLASDLASDVGVSDRQPDGDAAPMDVPRDMATGDAPGGDGGPPDAPPADGGTPCTTGSCAAQMYCNLLTHQCASGCENDSACTITGETCLLPGHSCVCPAGLRVCANVCAADSPSRCGSGCKVCPGTANGDATCSLGACGIACRAGFQACTTGCCRGFVIERVDPPVGGGGAQQPSFLFDAAGVAHVGYIDPTNNAVIHAERVGGVWTLEQIASPPIYYNNDGTSVSVAVDAGGDVHMVFRSDSDYGLRYARRTAGVWATEEIQPTAQAYGPSAIGVDPGGVVHIAFLTGPPYNLGHVWRAPGAAAWSFETIDATPSTGQYVSLAMDPGGHAHVAYLDVGNGDLKHAAWDGAAWQVETVDRAGNVGQYAAIAIDAAGRPRIAYHDATNLALKYAEWTGTSWTLTTVLTEFGSDTANYVHLALDATGAPWISFFSRFTFRTDVFTRAGTTWVKELIAADEPDGYASGVARDPSGNVAVLYTNTNEDNLWMARQSGANWIDEAVDLYQDAGDQSQLALDGSGRPHISYLNKSSNDVWYATRAANGVWTRRRIASAGTTGVLDTRGGYTSIALTAAGVPHVVWYDAGSFRLQHGSYNASTGIWTIDTVDPAPNSQPWPSMALDSGGQPHIAYVASTGLTVATRGAGGAYTTDAVPGGGLRPFLTLDAAGAPRLSLIDGTGKINYAFKSGATWTVEAIGAATAAATGLGFDGSGIPHVCFAQLSTGGYNILRHAVRGAAGGWTVDGPAFTSRDYGYHCSIALDAQNQPHITYQYISPGGTSLHHAVLQAGSWIDTVVETADLVTAWSTSIRIDATGAAQISYHDRSRHELKYARQP